MTITYSLEPIPKWYIADITGKPLGGGYIQCFQSLNHSVQKIVYEDQAGLNPWPVTVIGGINSIMFDENGSQGPFYWKLDSTNPDDQYYIRVYDINNVFQWDINDYPGTGSGGPSPSTANGLENLIVNSVMNNNFGTSPTPIASTAFKIAPSAHAGLAQTASNFGPDIWFIKSNISGSDTLQFVNFTLGSNDLTNDVTPVQFLRYTCTVEGTETFKFVQFPVTNKVQNLSNTVVTFSIWVRCNSGSNNLTLSCAQFFGDGGSPSASVVTPIDFVGTISSSWTKLTAKFTIPSVTGKVLGSCRNDGLFIRVNYPLSTSTILDFTKLCMYTGDVAPTEQYTPYDMTDAVTCSPRTGQTILTYESMAPFGYIPANGGTIGPTGSSANTRANNDVFPLYNLLWNNCLNNWVSVTGGRLGTSVLDFAAGNLMTIAQNNGRIIASLNPIITPTNFTCTVTPLIFTVPTPGGTPSDATATINITNTFTVATPVQVSNSGGALPATNFAPPSSEYPTFVPNTTYYVSANGLTGSTIQLSTTLQDAVSAVDYTTSITFSSAGTGTQSIVNSVNTLTLTTAQTSPILVGSPIQFTNTGGALPSGLLINTVYYVTSSFLTTTTITVNDNLTDALNGYFLPILSAGSGTNTVNTALGSYTGNSYTTDVALHAHQVTPEFNVLSTNNTGDPSYLVAGADNQLYIYDEYTTHYEGIEKISLVQPTIFMNLFVKL